jgi:hypothetical protein
MGPVIYTTYGIAMGHRSETLAESGGLRPAGAGRGRERTAQVATSRGRSWLDTLLVWVRLRHRDVDGRAGDIEETKPLPYPPVAATPQG